MRLRIEKFSRYGNIVGMSMYDDEAKQKCNISVGHLIMTVEQYLTFERALVLADAEMGKDFSVDLKVPSFREEREKESSGKERK